MKYFVICLCLFGLVFAGCSDSGESDLPVKTERFEFSDGIYQFYTNDSQYYGYGFWNYFLQDVTNNTYEVEGRKISGSIDGGYGMIIRNNADTDAEEKFYLILIYTDGFYYYGKYDGSQPAGSRWLDPIQDFTESPHINTGLNKINTIKAVKNSDGNFSVTVNGNAMPNFVDTDNVIPTSRVGFYASVASDESFPNTPVDIRFKLISNLVP